MRIRFIIGTASLGLVLAVAPLGGTAIGFAQTAFAKGGNGGGNGNGNGNGGDHGRANWRNQPDHGVVTVEVLNQLVRENPGNMTQAIRSWLTRGNKK